MRLIQHHSKGYWAAMISIASFVVIHGVFYFAHESINAAAPHQKLLYKLDRGIEPIENLMGFLHSEDDKLRDALTHIIERIEELEKVTLEPKGDTTTMANDLLFEISYELEHITTRIVQLAESNDATSHQALLLHAQSILEHMQSRVLAAQITSHTNTDAWETTLASIEHFDENIIAVIREAGIENTIAQEDANAIQAPTASLLPIAEAISPATENSCGNKLSVCENTADCCEEAGLTCQPTINSNGERTRRCMPNVGTVCEVRCSNNAWGTANNCKNTIVLPSYESCDDVERTSCSALANNTRNTRRCVL